MDKSGIDNLSYDELLKKYKELEEKMDHTKAVIVPSTNKNSAGATAIALFLICNVLCYMTADMMNTLGWVVTEIILIACSIWYYYVLSKSKRANKRARKMITKICGGNEDSLSDFGIEEIQRGKYLNDSAINTYWFVREHWLYQNKDGSRKKKILYNQCSLSVWWVVVSIEGKIYTINTQSKERIDWIIEKLRQAGYKITKNPESDDNEEDFK